MNEIKYLLEIADIKDTEYKNTLALTSLIELLIEKGICLLYTSPSPRD